ncbi:TetR family transcriptional regulator [Mesorhizobium sp. M4B.F.Ca.ET.215.01.1.1]|nr:TetR family transcriptional regulator [Mesorhizobium sp. M4B.F.Ca.ET.013.02.1.1]RVD45482.1 TetR family transcriptional regulator [Mesorhizobium sp. M4B.F.Ca.ET.019.03.1.1]RWF67695.1 MAG: TetR family transcriptional regulator [Mesorhizobium sp.]TGQ18387.1 TetR family transcriptional regulator [Mesorhizobium sp. M4B.F.Ca.ET.215.01.1.1]TGQ37130.1 TetR family transcriptional regulator [Mesorhizobium sp. M4B.F.Ca.ET.214.01.1.1]TGQ49356.1 TetR family transcriptional regulator [Mesorhizobium sp. M
MASPAWPPPMMTVSCSSYKLSRLTRAPPKAGRSRDFRSNMGRMFTPGGPSISIAPVSLLPPTSWLVTDGRMWYRYLIVNWSTTMIEKNLATRERLVSEGLKALILNGFDGVGLNAILQSARVPKGSFYYFFKSKEEFAGAVLDAYERHYLDWRDEMFKDSSCSPLKRLRNYFDAVEAQHLAEVPLGGCLFGVLSQVAAARSPEFRARLASVFSRWEEQLCGLLEEAKAIGEVGPSVDVKDAAAFLIDCYEGMLVRMKVDGDRGSFDRFRRLALDPLASGRQHAKNYRCIGGDQESQQTPE